MADSVHSTPAAAAVAAGMETCAAAARDAAAGECSEVAALPVTVCWRCKGAGTRTVKAPPRDGIHQTTSVACNICSGTGRLPLKSRRRDAPRPLKEFPGWRPVGPSPPVPDPSDATLALQPQEELNYLVGEWRIFQKVNAHRYSTDDVVTAWVAWKVGQLLEPVLCARTQPMQCLDIGCGIGSVLLMTAWLHPDAQCTGIEAQVDRFTQTQRSIRYNGVSHRVQAVNGDLRDPSLLGGRSDFDLVTGTPPYFDVTEGSLPGSEESARCLFEYRGGIEAYALGASKRMAKPHGLFVVCESALGVMRGYAAADAAHLRVLARIDAVPKAGKAPLFCVFVMCHKEASYFAVGQEHAEPRVQVVTPELFRAEGKSPYDEAAAVVASSLAAADDDVGAHGWDVDDGMREDATDTTAAHASGSNADATDGEAPSGHARRKRARPAPNVRPHPRSITGECVVAVTVRDAAGVRTPEYIRLLRDLGKPG